MSGPGPSERLTVIVSGMLLRVPLGGFTWSTLQLVLGLDRLGHDVWFVEDDGEPPWYYDPTRDQLRDDPGYSAQYADRVFSRFGLEGRWAHFDPGAREWIGPAAARLPRVLGDADLLITRPGLQDLRPWMLEVPVRALFDADPGFTQVRILTDAPCRELAEAHTAHFTIGERTDSLPDDGLAWLPTRHPVVVDAVPTSAGPREGAFTTVMHWDSFPAFEFDGRRYGMKSESFAPYLDLPSRTAERLEIAAGGAKQPPPHVEGAGWSVISALEPTWDPWAYLAYMRESKGEFTVSKAGYVAAQSGWFSERSATYMASGRPVVTQETGFSDFLETGNGLLPFNSPEAAAAAIEEASARYDHHCAAARELAREYFDAPTVLSSLVERAMSTTPADARVA